MQEKKCLRDMDRAFIVDMDGVIIRGNSIIPGAFDFIEKLKSSGIRFLFLTNNSYHTPAEQRERLRSMGLDVSENDFYTSAMAIASFLVYQRKAGCSAYVIGGNGLLEELRKIDVKVR
jgi:NagD protein